ncbi:MAG: RNA pyrophosphohydrolase [Phenylobacterium sp.]|jgi:putative (di)nucleoside polyphosphate hydrolase|nr:RNA pyrophosphohydrolase [Phenylobacterium sp.]MCA3708395.1 RNA pyrophosphohydrolase [Phenylobacterium sp.]MCA3711588.1 RNA pyrophosphohydrolase [Phenylobacterium sp.]MCA3715600.1 RNA pyrophosphohydrolase [Phenylobacterium sp.]MCA3730560.1 RNA pyrophosphohydrolase [Phenylobacterium sp.]MCA3741571.1 RNA pyrophosphohydrolase [Phenylobacterium sp.]
MNLDDYRPNVGLVLFSPEGRVWMGRRVETPPPYNWQFPQGGVDDGEDLEAAALRELEEETGITSVSVLGRTPGWIAYDYPIEAKSGRRGWKGQKQVWFALRFEGDETEVRLDQHHPVEFDAWRWAPLADAPELIVPFKKPVYATVAQAFAPLADHLAEGRP